MQARTDREAISAGFSTAIIVIALVVWASAAAESQAGSDKLQNQQNPNRAAENRADLGGGNQSPDAEAELQTGIALTRRGLFRDAIPHFLAAQGHVSNEYAADFNLALCYVGTNQFKRAIKVLSDLRNGGHSTAEVNNLLAQSYIGDSQNEDAFHAFQRARSLAPESEKLYVLMAEACMDHKNYALGVKVVDLGLQSLPNSARLHYERGMFLSLLDRLDLGKRDFELASTLDPSSDIAYIAAGQKDLLEGNISEAIRVAREGIENGHQDYILLTILGVALTRSGVSPGQPEFAEAQAALEKSVAEHPNDPSSEAALGKLCIWGDRLDDAVAHLELARQLDPGNKSVYSNLATAYRRQGKIQEAKSILAILAKLNDEEAAAIRSTPDEHKGIYGASGTSQGTQEPPNEK
jgi:tetratricopeptide (TPR) repeat protein